LRNDIHLMIDFYAAMRAGLTGKKLNPVATSGSKRMPTLPNVPTVAEAGVPGYEVTSWNGICGPAGTPAAVIGVMNKALREILALAEVKKQYAEVGIEAQATSPEALRGRLVADIKKWSAVVERAKIPRK
jgi:tripartite-type tricarboxylate transporter receptor subunit TctC